MKIQRIKLTLAVIGLLLSVDAIAARGKTELIVECPSGMVYKPLIAPTAAVTGATLGLCESCFLEDPYNIIDTDQTDFATMTIPAGIGGSVVATVEDAYTTFSAGDEAGFIVNKTDGQESVTTALLQYMKLVSLLDGQQQQVATTSTPVVLDVAGITNDATKIFVNMTTTEPLNTIQLQFGGLASISNTLNIYGAGVCEPGATSRRG